MNDLTDQKVGPIDVRAELLKVIGTRKDGVSRHELTRKMHQLAKREGMFFYEGVLASLIMEGLVLLSYCGLDNHKSQVYSLCSEEKDRREKKCRVCGMMRPIKMYWKRCDSKDGHDNQCKLCANKQRKVKGWGVGSNEALKRKRRGISTVKHSGNPPYVHPQSTPSSEEVDAAAIKIKAEAFESNLTTCKPRYVVVNGRVFSASDRPMSPVEEYNRAWKRIKVS